jgi:hypothetical protein
MTSTMHREIPFELALEARNGLLLNVRHHS